MATKATGRLAEVLIGFQADFDTAAATFFDPGFISEGVSGTRNLDENPEIRGNPNPSEPVEGVKSVTGPYVPVFRFDSAGVLFKAALGSPTTNASGTVASEVFDGSGLDDLTSSGTYSAADRAQYEIEIDAVGTPDTFKWRVNTISALGVTTNGSYTPGVAITGASQSLSNGVAVTFAATTGHTLADKWTIEVYGQNHHVFKITSTPPPYVSYEKGFTDTSDYWLNEGCMFSQLGCTVTAETGVMRFDVQVMGARYTIGTSSVSGGTTDYDSTPVTSCNFLGALEGGSDYDLTEQFEWTLDNQVDTAYLLTDTPCEIGVLQRGGTTVAGTLTSLFEDLALQTKANNGTESSYAYAVGSGNYWCRFEFPELKYQFQAPSVGDSQLVREALPFIGYYADNSDSSAIVITLFNDVASY